MLLFSSQQVYLPLLLKSMYDFVVFWYYHLYTEELTNVFVTHFYIKLCDGS